MIYKPFRLFGFLGVMLLLSGMLICARFLYFFFTGGGGGNIQSLILASILIGIGFQTMLMAFVTDLLAANRRLLEDIRTKSLYPAPANRDRKDSI